MKLNNSHNNSQMSQHRALTSPGKLINENDLYGAKYPQRSYYDPSTHKILLICGLVKTIIRYFERHKGINRVFIDIS